MADIFKPIVESDYSDKGVRNLPSRVSGDAATIQRVFDELSLDILIPAVNAIVNSLNSLNIDKRVTSEDIKGFRLNSDNVIEVTLNGLNWITVSDAKGSIDALKIYLIGYANGIKEDLETRKADKTNVLSLNNKNAYTPITPYNPATKKYVDETKEHFLKQIKACVTVLSIKADKSNVLEKNNTEKFIPTSDYHPATKKYVDEKTYNAAYMTKAVYDPTGRNTDIFGYVDSKIGDIDLILDDINNEVV